ncbi:hypothetical protein TWF696_008024 [Orbilia brochopaga]
MTMKLQRAACMWASGNAKRGGAAFADLASRYKYPSTVRRYNISRNSSHPPTIQPRRKQNLILRYNYKPPQLYTAAMSTNTKLYGNDITSTAVIRQVAENVTTVSVPFLRVGLLKFGGRATITKLSSGGLVVFSPTPLTTEVSDTVTALGGQVSYIVAPDIEHHLNIGPWKAAYPSARVIGPTSLYTKRQKQNNEDVPFDLSYTAANKRSIQLPDDLAADFDLEFFDGHSSHEVVMCHRPSGTLIEADLLFNLPAHEQFSKVPGDAAAGFWTRVSMHLFTSLKGKSQQRTIWYGLAKNRQSFNESIKRVDGWNFDRIIPCHGDVIETGGKDAFRRLFAWHLAAAEAESKKQK